MEIKNTKSNLCDETFTEIYDIKMLNLLLNKNNLHLLVQYDNDDKVKYNETTLLSKIKKKLNKNKLTVIYNSKVNYGRIYPMNNLSYGGMRKELRHTLLRDINTYIDIDVVNCHPQILNQLCFKYNIKNNVLNEYVLNRERYLQMIMNSYNVSRCDAKTNFMLKLQYGGRINCEQINEDKNIKSFLDAFTIQLLDISKELMYHNKIKLNLKKGNEYGSFLSIYMQTIEREVLENVYKYLKENNYIKNNECVLCFDGLMMLRSSYNDSILG